MMTDRHILKKLTCRYIIDEIHTRRDFGLKLQINKKKTAQHLKLFLKKPRQAHSMHKNTLKQLHMLHLKTLTESLTHNETHD